MLKKLQVKIYIIYKICTDEVLYGNGNVTVFYHFLLDLFMFKTKRKSRCVFDYFVYELF